MPDGWSGSTGPFAPCAARTTATSPDAVGSVDPARASASISVMPPVSDTGPGAAHLAHDEHALAAVLLDRHGDLRVLEVAVGQLLLQLALERRAASGRRP